MDAILLLYLSELNRPN
uniref:Uncharacterized protein n=1 Tax=Arundo donax TaxID=35708 RepID=A0A0A9THQ2_ARUDO